MRHTQLTKLFLALGLALVGVLPALAQAPLPVKAVYAEQYNQWNFNSQAANTYTFSGTNCQSFPLVDGATSPYFVFGPTAAAYPVFIQDANPANSEIVTPTSTSSVSSACGFAASAVNQHTSFTVRSGTAGLQDAVGTLSSTSLVPMIVYLDRTWYALVNGLPGAPSAQSIILALTGGSTGVVIVDTTTAPSTYYSWDGTKYRASGSTGGFPNLKTTSYTNIAAPTALSTGASTFGILTTSATGGTIPASSTYRLAITYVDASGGETTISTDSASTSTIATGTGSTNSISVTSPATATGAVGYRVYMSAAAGASLSEILYTPTCTNPLPTVQWVLPRTTVCSIGSSATITAVSTGTALIPGISSAYPRGSGTSGSYPPWTAGGALSTTVTGTLAEINLPAGYLNVLGRSFQICGNGNATTNSTPGTLTVKGTLSSIYGVTTITPWSVVSGTTSASAVVPFNFCATFTTAATGATGTLWVHGCVNYGLAGTAPATAACDVVVAVSSTVDLTAANTLALTLTPATTGVTAYQLTQLSVDPIN